MQLLLYTAYTVALLVALLLLLVASISAYSLPGCHAELCNFIVFLLHLANK